MDDSSVMVPLSDKNCARVLLQLHEVEETEWLVELDSFIEFRPDAFKTLARTWMG